MSIGHERPAASTVSTCEEDTAQVGRDVARALPNGGLVLLFGELGAGKTVFVRGLVEGVGGDPARVSSPTFTLIQSYEGCPAVQHVDLYRLQPDEAADLGLDELVTQGTIVAIEWAERLLHPLGESVRVHLVDCGANRREILVQWPNGEPS